MEKKTGNICAGSGCANPTISYKYRFLEAHFCNTDCQTALHLEMWMPLERGGRSGSRSTSSGSRSGSSGSRSRSGSGGRRYRSPKPDFVKHRGEYYTRSGWRARGSRLWRKPRYGYGYSVWTTWRYPFLLDFLPYDLWYPTGEWVPYYYVSDDAYVKALTRNGEPIPPEAYVRNTTDFDGVSLPSLPTFASLGIRDEALRRGHGKDADAVQARDAITAELSNLRTQYASEEARGFRIVPDLDRSQFSWVKVL